MYILNHEYHSYWLVCRSCHLSWTARQELGFSCAREASWKVTSQPIEILDAVHSHKLKKRILKMIPKASSNFAWRNSGTEKRMSLKGLKLVEVAGKPWHCYRDWKICGDFKYFLFSSLPGEMIQFDYIIFFKWVVQPPTSYRDWKTSTLQHVEFLTAPLSDRKLRNHRENQVNADFPESALYSKYLMGRKPWFLPPGSLTYDLKSYLPNRKG